MRYTILSKEMKALRKAHGLTQEDLALKAGVGLRFVRELEQGKRTLRMDKVNQVFELFGMQLAPVKISTQSDSSEVNT